MSKDDFNVTGTPPVSAAAVPVGVSAFCGRRNPSASAQLLAVGTAELTIGGKIFLVGNSRDAETVMRILTYSIPVEKQVASMSPNRSGYVRGSARVPMISIRSIPNDMLRVWVSDEGRAQ